MGNMKIGVISDTHGLLRPQVIDALSEADVIIHAGDVGRAEVLMELEKLAPVYAVRGNVDTYGDAEKLPKTQLLEIGGLLLFVIHDISQLNLDPKIMGVDIVISGHSHKASQKTEGGILFLNPGSVGPRRFSLPISMAFVHIESGRFVVSEINF